MLIRRCLSQAARCPGARSHISAVARAQPPALAASSRGLAAGYDAQYDVATLGRQVCSRDYFSALRPTSFSACRSFASSSSSSSRGGSSLRSGGKTWREVEQSQKSSDHVWWIAAFCMAVFGFVWALVPLYKIYCQSTGQGQAQAIGHKEYSAPPAPGSKAAKRLITVDFSSTVHDALPWEFVPQQRRITVGVGETALAFYRAKNNSDRPIIGVSVYHMLPSETGLYFNKIQCFCFDEQLINPREEVDLPIFFFIDPLMAADSRFDHIDHITLNYLFFESDSELPEEYQEYLKGSRSSQAPLALDAPASTPAAA